MAWKILYTNEQWLELAEKSAFRAEAMAKRLDISPRQLERRIENAFGCKLHKWLREKRLLKAPEMLRGEKQIKAIATEMGFKEHSHFSRVFTRQYGLSPSAFRERERLSGSDPGI